jgi:hypothetical protein
MCMVEESKPEPCESRDLLNNLSEHHLTVLFFIFLRSISLDESVNQPFLRASWSVKCVMGPWRTQQPQQTGQLAMGRGRDRQSEN